MKKQNLIALLSVFLALGVMGGISANEPEIENKDVGFDESSYQSEMFLGDLLGEGTNAGDTVSYTVEYYLENSNGVFVLNDEKCYTSNGVVGEVVEATAIDLPNYTLVSELSTQTKTLGRSNNVLRVYYKLSKCDIAVKYYFENLDGSYSQDESKSYNFVASAGKTVNANVIFAQNYELNESLSTLEGTAGDVTELSVYYSLKSCPYTVEYYLETNGEYVLDASKTQSLYAKFGKTVEFDAPSVDGYAFVENVSKTELLVNEKNNVLYLYYKLERPTVSVEYFFEKDGEWVKNDALTQNYKVNLGDEFTTPVHSAYQHLLDEQKSTLHVAEVVESSVLAVYYKQERHTVQITDVCSLITDFEDNYKEVIASNYVAKLYNEKAEFDVTYSDGAFVASLVDGEYYIEITSGAFVDKYQAKINVDGDDVTVVPVTTFSALALNKGGTTTLTYDEDNDVWVNDGQDSSSLSYITANASENVAVNVTVTAKLDKYVVNQNWVDSEQAVGVTLINSQNTSSTVFIGLYKNGVKVVANGQTSTISRDYFNNFTQAKSQTTKSTLSVARLSNGEIYIYRDGKWVGWITSDGWCSGVRLSESWLSYVGEKSYVATCADAENDYKEFVFSDIEYSFSQSVAQGFAGANYTFSTSDGFSVSEKAILRNATATVNATTVDGKVLKAVLVNGQHYLNATVNGENIAIDLATNPTRFVRKTNDVSLVYEDLSSAVEISGRVLLSDWLSLTSEKTIKLISEQGITYVCTANEQGGYKINAPCGKYTLYATCGRYICAKQNIVISGNTAVNLTIDQYDFTRFTYKNQQDDIAWVYADENAITLNGRINEQKIGNLCVESYSGNFAYSIDMIQAWKNHDSKFNTSDDVTGILLQHSSGKYLAFYVESSSSKIRILSNNGSWATRVNVKVNVDLYRKTDETSHRLSIVKNNGAIFFLIDGEVQFALDGTKIINAKGQEITDFDSYSHSSGKTTMQLLNETVNEILTGGSVTVGVGTGFSNANLATVDKTGYKNALITEKQEVIDSLLVASYGLSVEKDENVTVTLVSDGYDYVNGEITQNTSLRLLVEAKQGYTLDYVLVNGANVYLKPYTNVYLIEFDQISRDTVIKVKAKEQTGVTVTGKLRDSVDYDKAIVTYFADSVLYTTTPNSDGSFSIQAFGQEGSLQVVYADGKVRNIPISALDENLDVGEISPVATEWSHKDFDVEAAMDVVASDDNKYIFAIGTSERSSDKKGHFYVYSVEENKVVASIEENLGNCRQIAYENGYCYVTARDDGMWVIDVTDYGSENSLTPDTVKPEIVCHYDSVEMATGIIVHDSTVFIANRTYGVEVVDVTNPSQPKFITNIQTGEVQSLEINDGLLFAGIWGEQKVLVVDISDLVNAKTLYSVPLDGRGDGVFVEDGFLYAATGHHARGDYSSSSAPAWGKGNGLEVFRVDRNGYEKIFGIKFDEGFEDSMDMWEPVKAGNYVYVTNTFNGTYVYDVTDIYNPVHVAHLHCDKTSASTNNATGIAVVDGSIFVTGGRGGLFRYDNPDVKAPTPNAIRRGDIVKQDKADEKIVASGSLDYQVIKTVGQVRSIVVTDKYILTANGNEGINVYDKTNNTLINTVNTGYIVKELQVDGNYLYSAEDAGGLAIYDLNSIQNANVTPLYRYDATTLGKTDNVKLVQTLKCDNSKEGHPLAVTTYDLSKSVTAVAINEIRYAQYQDKKYMILHAGGSWLYIADITDIANVKVIYKCVVNNGVMYGRNLAQTVVDGKYFVMSASTLGFVYLNIDGSGVARNSADTDYLYHNAWRTDTTASRLGVVGNGITTVDIDGEYKVMFTTGHGYRILDREIPSIYDNQIYGNVAGGWPVVLGDVLVVSNRMAGELGIYDISDVYNPTKIASYVTNTSPDLATRDANKLYVPLGYFGFMVINLD